MLAQEIIRIKRDGRTLERADIEHFVRGLVDGSWSEGQAAALAMAMFLRGMSRNETVNLTPVSYTHLPASTIWIPIELNLHQPYIEPRFLS